MQDVWGPSTLSRRALMAALPAGAAAAGVASAAVAAPPVKAQRPAPPLSTPQDAVVETAYGKVRGYLADGVYTYKGVPYGADTGGSARFQPPRPPAPWTGVRSSLAYGPICPQTADSSSDAMAFLLQPVVGVQSEDCLRLNIWTPSVNDSARRPVMVWIHGGEFSNGSSQALPACDGENLSRRGDVVVVSVNHRLNALGYINLADIGGADAYPHAANAGMLDLVAALAWVRDNIGRFGGDPGCVTVFGQSGGGLKITTLQAMPAAKGLFHRAIVQSGSQTRIFSREVNAKLASALLDELGLTASTMSKLKDVPADRLVAAAAKAQTRFYKFPVLGENIWTLVGWAPTLDGHDVASEPYALDNRLFLDVPLMVGCTLNEFNPALMGAGGEMSEADLHAKLVPAFPGRADLVLSTFRQRHPTLSPVRLYTLISAAAFNRSNAVEQAALKARQGGAAYLYRFDWQTPVLDGLPGAYHCSELPFVFDTIDRVPSATGAGPRAHDLARRMSDAWIAFARTGDPNHAGLPTWPKVSPQAVSTLVFDEVCKLEGDTDRAERQIVGRS